MTATTLPTLAEAKSWMRRWRLAQRAGLVIFWEGEAFEWASFLDKPSNNRPGCIAIDLASGQRFRAEGGNFKVGAERWVPIA